MSETEIELRDLANKIAGCNNCNLFESRGCTMPGYGECSADIMIIGAAVPHYLAGHGRPFIGATGSTLRLVLQEVGIPEERVYLTNIVKCSLPRQTSSLQDPLPHQVQACACWPRRGNRNPEASPNHHTWV